MHPEVAKFVEAGRINQAVGERISQLAPGNYLLSKTWGAGKVTDWNLREKKIIVDFADRTAQEMDLQFAMQRTEYLDDSDFRAKKLEQTEELRLLASHDAVSLVIHVLESHQGSMTLDAFEKSLCGTVIPEKEYKKWWDATKKSLAAGKRVIVPTKRTDQMSLRSGSMSPVEALLLDVSNARELKVKCKALEAISSEIQLFSEQAEALSQLYTELDAEIRRGLRLNLGSGLELLVIRDQIARDSKQAVPATCLSLSEVLQAEFHRVAEAMASLSAARQREIYDIFPKTFGDVWGEKLMTIVEKAGARGVGEIAKIFDDHKQLPELEEYLRKAITRRSLGHDALIWVCRERKGISKRIFSAEVGAAILNQLETDFIADGPRKAQRLQSLMSEDKELIGDLVAMMDINEARNFGRRLMECPVFNDLDRKSLMARVIKARPETAELVSGENKRKKDEDLLVSWESLERKKAELEDLVRNRIPQNTKDISIARSYGDLRENFEYKSAKDMQTFLSNRKAELERDISIARGTDFRGADASSVNIGTVVTIRDQQDVVRSVSVLGAWDSDPEKNMLSYLSEAGASLLGATIGSTVELRNPTTDALETWTVVAIAPYVTD